MISSRPVIRVRLSLVFHWSMSWICRLRRCACCIGERNTGFFGEFQDKIGKFIVQGDRHRGRACRFPDEELLSNTKLRKYAVEQFAVVFPAENCLKLSSRSFDLKADEFTIGM